MAARSGAERCLGLTGALRRPNGTCRPASSTTPAPRFVAADQLAKAVNLDMADWWTPTGESYLSRVKKDQILEAISEGTGETNLEELCKLKKGELAAAAEARLSGTRWLPEILRA
jgi:hypothetical protein